jgi:hypothetical protein
LKDARWIWYPEGSPASSAPVGTRRFTKNFEIPSGKTISQGAAVVTADNSFKLRVNGHIAGTGDNFNVNYVLDIGSYLKTGTNTIEIDAANEGDSPNPAGLIGSFAVAYRDGSIQRFFTGTDWNTSLSSGGSPRQAMDIGPMNMSPWSKSDVVKEIYPGYASIAQTLKSRGINPDFSSGAPIRYTHRHIPDVGDIYFVSNRIDAAVATSAIFRTAGRQPEWWNPLDGSTRDLPNSTVSNGRTTVPLRLEPRESGFVVFLKPRQEHKGTVSNFPVSKTVSTLANPWTVSFSPRWGGPAKTTFTQLSDWIKNTDPGIRDYSGTAIYTTTFDAPKQSLSDSDHLSLSLGDVKDLASVKINGKDLGIVWCKPWTVEIPSALLKPTGNRLEISVANLWINRLIADSALPESQRLTSTNGNDYNPGTPLQPSGLLGPVKLLATKM